MKGPAVVLLLLLLLLALCGEAHGYGVRVRARQEECFGQFIGKGRPFTVQFQVVSGGHLDVDFAMKDPKGEVMHEEFKKTDSKMSFVAAEEGVHEVCFSNRMSRVTSKSVVFDVWFQDKLQPGQTEAAKREQLSGIWQQLHTLRSLVDGARHDQKYLILRLRRHMETSESNASRVRNWFTIECVLLLLMAGVQALFLRMHIKKSSAKASGRAQMVPGSSGMGTPGRSPVPGGGMGPGIGGGGKGANAVPTAVMSSGGGMGSNNPMMGRSTVQHR